MVTIWTNKLSLDNRVLDFEHKNIIDQINMIDDLIDGGNVDELISVVRQLINSLCAYFQTEESIADAIGIDFSKHKVAHQQLLNELLLMRDRLEECSNQRADTEAKNLTVGWAKNFTQHIRKEGRQMKAVLGTLYYDFLPD